MENKQITTIIDLCRVAYDSEGLPDVFYAQGNPINKDLLLANGILVPALLVVANKLHYMSTGKSMLLLDGKLAKSKNSPFGIILTRDGFSPTGTTGAVGEMPDIRLSDLGYSVGVMVNYFCAAARMFKPLLNEKDSAGFNKLHISWHTELFADFDEGEEITLGQTEKMPIITLFYES